MAKKNNNVGLNFTADVVDLKTGLKTVQEEIKKADKEFNHNTASLDKWSASSEGLTEKLNQLNTRLNAQKKSVELYQAEIERVSKLEGDHSSQLENLKAKLKDAETAVKKTEKEIGHYSDSLADVTKKEKEENSSLGKLTKTIEEQESKLKDLGDEYRDAVITYGKNSKEAKELKGEISKLSDELKDNKKQVQFADKQLELLDDQFDDTADSAEQFSKGIDGIKDLGSKVAGGLATITASIGALAGAFLATATESKEFRTNMGKLETGFETSGLKAEQAAETYKNLFAVVADEGKATEAAAMIGQLATSQEDLNKWVNISTGVYATFGDSLPIENLAEAALETSKTGAITGGLADALNWAGISEEKFQESLDACTTEQERQKLITETLNSTYDEASRKYQQVNKDVIDSNKAQVNLTDTMAKLGEKAEPILTVVKEGFNQVLQEILKLTEGVDFNAIAEKIKGGFAYFIDTIIPAIKNGFQWILDNKDVLIAGIVAIGTGMLAWNVVSIIQGVVGAIKAWTVATEGMTVAQRLLNLAMNANPIGIIITVITALVTAFVTLWNTSDEFRQFWIDLWEKIKEATSIAITKVKEFFSKLWTDIKAIWSSTVEWFKDIGSKISDGFKIALDKVKEFFSNSWEKIKNTWSSVSTWFSNVGEKIVNAFKNIPTKIKDFFSNAWNNVKNAWSSVTSFFTDTKDRIINAFKELPSKMLDVGKNLVEGLWNGIKNMASWVKDKIKGFSNDVLDGIKGFFGIHSPSKKMAEIGEYLDEGLAQGIEKGKDEVIDSVDELAKDTMSKLENSLQVENQGKIIDKELALGIEKEKKSVLGITENLATQTNDTLVNNINGEEIGNQLDKDLVQGIKSGKDSVLETTENLGVSINNTLKETINSEEIGKYISQGIASGVTDSKDLAFEAITGVTKEVAEKNVQAQIDKINSQPKTASISPVFTAPKQVIDNKSMQEAIKAGVDSYEELEEYIKNNEVTYTDLGPKIETLDEALNKKSQEKFGVGLEELTQTIENSNEYKEVVDLVSTLEDSEKYKEDLVSTLEDDIERLKSSSVSDIKDVDFDDERNKKEEKTLKKEARELKEETKKIREELEETPKSFLDRFKSALKISEEDLKKWSDGLGGKLSKVYSFFEGVGSKIGELGKAILDNFNSSIDNQVKQLDYELQLFKKEKDAEIKKAEETYDEELELQKKALEQGLLTNEEYKNKEKKLEQDLANAKKKIEDEKRNQEEETLRRKNELAKKQFNAQKANDIATALINGAQAILKGYAQLGPIGGSINAIAQGTITAFQIDTIKSQKFIPMLAKGGIVNSPTLAMIGEAGKEAVMPLENNLGWISELAEKISAIMQKDYSLATPQMQMGYAGNPTVNNYYDFNQTINSPKQLTRRQIYRDTKNLLALKGR